MAMSNITVAGLTPDLAILGDYQNFKFGDTDPIVKVQAYSQFVPTVPNDSVINIVSRNYNLAGFRGKHTTKTTSAQDFGEFVFEAFESDGAGTIVPIWSYIDTPGEMGIYLTLNMNSHQIQHVDAIAMNNAHSYFGGSGQIAFDNTYAAKRIQLYGAVAAPGNNFQYMGFGTASTGILGYNTITGGKHIFYAATSSSAKATLAEIAESYNYFPQIMYGRTSSALMYFSGSTTNTSLTSNTWAKVSGTTSVSSENAAGITSPFSNRLTYNPASALGSTFIISASISFQNQGTLSSPVVSFGIYKNGTTLLNPQCKENIFVSTTSSVNATVQVMESLAPTDYIELWAMMAGTNGTIRVTDASIVMIPV